MTDYLITFAAITSFGSWSALMVAAGIYGQRARQKRQDARDKAERIAALVAYAERVRARQRPPAAPQYPEPSPETIKGAQA